MKVVDTETVEGMADDCNAVHCSYQYRLYPSKRQKSLLAQHFGAVRFVYNHFLAKRQSDYLDRRRSSNYFDDQAALVAMKKSGEYDWMYDVNSQSLQAALKNLSTAYLKFFRGETKFPRFHSKRGGRDCFAVPQNVAIKDGKLVIPKFKEGIRVKVDRPWLGKICFASVRRTSTNKYFVSVTCLVDRVELMRSKGMDASPNGGKAVGIDLGIKDLAITSDGLRFKNLKTARKSRKKLDYLHRQLSKKKKGSKRRERVRLHLAKLHEKISSKRRNHIHNVTTRLVRENQAMAIEDLSVVNMMKNHRLAGAIADCAWGEFARQLEYKCSWYGRELAVVGRFYPSSKTCRECDHVNHGLTLRDRNWVCPNCGARLDRDVNAARNILRQGLAVLSGSGTESDVKQKPGEASSAHHNGTPSRPLRRGVCEPGNPRRL